MPRTVHLYVFDGYADWEPALAIAGLGHPQFQREPGTWQVRTVAARQDRPVRSMGGVTVLPDLALAALQPESSAMLVVPGGEGWDASTEVAPELARSHQACIDKACEWLALGIPVAAICGATAGLARAGVLDHRAHTSNALSYLNGTGYAGAGRYVDHAAVREGPLVTAGGMSPLEFAHEIFAVLGVYEDSVLEAWYQLYKTGQSKYFARLARAAAATG